MAGVRGNLFAIFIVLSATLTLEAQPSGVISSPFEDGSPYSRVPDGSSSLASPFLTTRYHGTASPYNGPGISLFTGQTGFSLPLASIQVRGRAGFSVGLEYAGNTRNAFRDDNRTTPTSWVGLGWNIRIPYIARNHKGTVAVRDDLFYADLGPLGQGMLVRGTSGTYYMSGNPYLTLTPGYATSGAFNGQIETWDIRNVDGTLWVFGDFNGAIDSTERVAYQTNGSVRVSPYSIGNAATTPFIYRWDIRYIADPENKNRILFDYQRKTVNLFNSGKHSFQQSYPKTIRYLDRSGNEAERIQFVLGDKDLAEYVTPHAELPITTQEPLETKFLSSIHVYHAGVESNNVSFTYTTTGSGKYLKRLLDEVRPTSRLNPTSGTFVAAPIWKFTYDPARNGLLNSVQKPNGGKSDFEYTPANLGASGQQTVYSDANNRLKNDAGTIVSFPASSAWENTSSCAERYCILAAKDGNKVGGKLYLEFSSTRGNYVDGAIHRKTYTAASTTVASNWKWAASGDYVAVYDANAATVYVHQWDGVNWSTGTNQTFDFGPVSGASNPLAVHVAPNYFVVTQAGNPLNKAWVYIKRDNTWTRLNTGTPCDLDNNGNFGETVKNSGYGCLEFNSTLKVAVTPTWFSLVHDATDIVFTYALSKDGNNFTNISGTFLNFGDGVQHATYPNNWSQNITQVIPGPEYLLVQSVNATQQRLDVMHLDGVNIRRVSTSGWENGVAADLTASTAENYFVTINQSIQRVHLWRRASITGGFQFTRTEVRGSVPTRTTARITLRTFPEAFTFEYGRLSEEIGGQPIPLLEGTSDLSTWLYQVDPIAPLGFRDRSPDIRYSVAGGTTKLFGIRITPDNFLGGLTVRNSGSQASVCPVGGSCKPFLATMKVRRGETGTPYANTARAVEDLNIISLSKHVVFNVARTGMLSWFDGTAQFIRYRHFAFDGDDFAGAPEGLYKLSKVIEHSGVSQTGHAAGPNLMNAFTYDETNGEFNYHLQLPQYPKVTQKQVAADNAENGRVESIFNMDSPSSKWYGRTLRMNGTIKETQAFNQANNPISLTRNTYRPFADLVVLPDWPVTIPLVRLANTYSQDIRPNGSKMGMTTYFNKFNNKNGRPHFTKTFQDDIWKVNQTLYNSNGLETQSLSFALPAASYPGAGPNLETQDSTVRFNNTHAVASSKTEYDPANPYYPLKSWIWRDVDQNLTDAQLQAGNEPTFNLDENWIPASDIRRRNIDLQVEETRFEKHAGTGGESFQAQFYEGRKQRMTGSVSNSQLPNCAILMAENGDIPGLAALDLPGRWERFGTAFATNYVRSGRYSVKVTDNFGPTINLRLENVRRDGFGYVVSAWILRPLGSTNGGLRVERRDVGGNVIETRNGVYVPQDPYDSSFPLNGRWERWEVRFTNAELIAPNLFNGSADYLRIWVGTGQPTGNSAQVIYVDDIVCTPTNARFNLQTYDYRGFPTSTTDGQHRSSFHETDYLGNVTGVRDERYKMTVETATNRVGEN